MMRGVLLFWMALFTLPPAVAGDTQLLMFELPNCAACAAFEADVGGTYDQTDEASVAPLRRLPFGSDPPGIALNGEVQVSPTFVLIRQGREIDRFVGYTRDEAFWMSLNRLLNQLD
ncbi:MAG: hypothetical protein CMN28_09165 [Salinisphaeraceae bacterium]|nr:hypothetical protein [Salinisphaeraceae bacterium]